MSLYESWWEEKRSAYLYGIMSEYETSLRNKKLFHDLQLSAEKQAALWEAKIRKNREKVATFSPDLRTRIIVLMVKWLGTKNITTILAAMKIRGMSIFKHEIAEHKHLTMSATSNLRAAIFGINDGLISNMSLILGIAGANANEHFIVIAGVAGLLAGACSMGAGEYISVRSQREVFEYQIAIEKQELEEYPEEEMEELSLIYQARNIPKREADHLAKIMINNPETGLSTLAREELGINPEDMISPTGAMFSSFCAFSIGAAIPVLPFIIHRSSWNLSISITATGITLFIIGALLSLYTNRNPLLSGLRMLFIGAIAGTATYLIGMLLGVRMG